MRHTAILAILLIASAVVGVLLLTSHNSASAASASPAQDSLGCVDCETPVRIQEGDSFEVPEDHCLIVQRIGFQLAEDDCRPPPFTVVVDVMVGTNRVQGAMFYYAPVNEDGAGPMGVLPMLSIEPGLVLSGPFVSVRDLTVNPTTGACVTSAGTQAQAFGLLVPR